MYDVSNNGTEKKSQKNLPIIFRDFISSLVYLFLGFLLTNNCFFFYFCMITFLFYDFDFSFSFLSYARRPPPHNPYYVPVSFRPPNWVSFHQEQHTARYDVTNYPSVPIYPYDVTNYPSVPHTSPSYLFLFYLCSFVFRVSMSLLSLSFFSVLTSFINPCVFFDDKISFEYKFDY